ncbi:Os02g0100150, partial [Oryza sativa Japonica Group]
VSVLAFIYPFQDRRNQPCRAASPTRSRRPTALGDDDNEQSEEHPANDHKDVAVVP